MDLSPATHHVLVDFENMHEVDIAIIGRQSVAVTVLLGPSQPKLEVRLVEKLLQHASSVQLVRLDSHGRNAVDFALAYYVGRAVAADPSGYFHIVSRDTGYDPLIQHLRGRNIHADRHDDFSSLPFMRTVTTVPPRPEAPSKQSSVTAKPVQLFPEFLDENAQHVLNHLRKHPKNRPAREKTLIKHVLTLFGGKLTEANAQTLIENLVQAGRLSLGSRGELSYHL